MARFGVQAPDEVGVGVLGEHLAAGRVGGIARLPCGAGDALVRRTMRIGERAGALVAGQLAGRPQRLAQRRVVERGQRVVAARVEADLPAAGGELGRALPREQRRRRCDGVLQARGELVALRRRHALDRAREHGDRARAAVAARARRACSAAAPACRRRSRASRSRPAAAATRRARSWRRGRRSRRRRGARPPARRARGGTQGRRRTSPRSARARAAGGRRRRPVARGARRRAVGRSRSAGRRPTARRRAARARLLETRLRRSPAVRLCEPRALDQRLGQHPGATPRKAQADRDRMSRALAHRPRIRAGVRSDANAGGAGNERYSDRVAASLDRHPDS